MISSYKIKKECTLRNFLESHHLSKQYISKLIFLNAISNSNKYLKEQDVLLQGEEIYINYSLLEENNVVGFDYDIDVIYEDNEIIAVEKPRGMLVHSDGIDNCTMLNAVSSYLYNKGDDSCVRCLHRIDYDTTGILLFSKNILAYSLINYQIENLLILKEYIALVEGKVLENGYVDMPIGKDRHNSKKSIAIKSGKPAFTQYEIIESYKNTTLLKVNITTGRTHQIRVHMAYIGHPIVGDSLYGKGGKLMLHFNKVQFMLFGQKMIITSKKKVGE